MSYVTPTLVPFLRCLGNIALFDQAKESNATNILAYKKTINQKRDLPDDHLLVVAGLQYSPACWLRWTDSSERQAQPRPCVPAGQWRDAHVWVASQCHLHQPIRGQDRGPVTNDRPVSSLMSLSVSHMAPSSSSLMTMTLWHDMAK